MSNTVVGGRITHSAPVFSLDGKALFVSCGAVIKVLSVATGETLTSLSGQHTARVTVVLTNPLNPLQLYSCSLDGTVRVWDYADGVCLRTYDVGASVTHACLSDKTMILNVSAPTTQPATTSASASPIAATAAPASSSSAAAAATTAVASTNTAAAPAGAAAAVAASTRIIALKLDSGKTFLVYKNKSCSGMGVSPDREFICSIAKRTLSVWSVGDEKLIKHYHERRLTALAFHPTDSFVATGDCRGQITLWYDYGSSDNENSKCVTSSLHWHAHAVSSLVFSDDGAYLLSGGEEAVLVLWQLETGHKQFLPRLGATIHHISISADGKTYALSCADNSIRLIGAISNQIERHIKGLAHAHTVLLTNGSSAVSASTPTTVGGPLVCDPAAAAGGQSVVALSGLPGAIQWYDVATDRPVAEVVVVPRNLVSRTDDEFRVFHRIEQILLSGDGQTLVTVDRRIDVDTAEHIALKFWDRNTTLTAAASHSNAAGTVSPPEPFTLNTRVDTPHKAKITAAAFHPSRPIVVTASADRMFKIWTQKPRPYESSVSVSAHVPPSTYWACQSVGFYRPYAVHDCSFSADGSLLAVVYGQVVTLWDPYTVTLRHTLTHPPPSEHIRFVRFIPSTPFLVCATTQTLYVWNLLTLSVWWSYALPVIGLSVDAINTTTPHFAVAVSALVPKSAPATAAAAVPDSSPKSIARALSFAATPKKKSNSDVKSGSSDSKKQSDRDPFDDGVDADEETMEERIEKEHLRTSGNPTSVSHLLLFTAESPVPVCVWSVPDIQIEHGTDSFVASHGSTGTTTASAAGPYRIARIAFSQRQTGTTTGAASESGDAATSNVCRSLVYLNTSKQLVRIDHVTSSPSVAAAAAASDDTAASSSLAAGRSMSVASSAVRRMLAAAEQHTSAFEKLYGKSKSSATAATAVVVGGATGKRTASAAPAAPASDSSNPIAAGASAIGAGGQSEVALLFNGPTHAIPPLSTLYSAYMHLLSQHTTIASAAATSASAFDAAASSAASAEVDVKSSAAKGLTSASSIAESNAALPIDSTVLDAQLLAADVKGGSGLFSFNTSAYAAVMKVFDSAPAAVSAVAASAVAASDSDADSSVAAADSKSANGKSAAKSKRTKSIVAATPPASEPRRSKRKGTASGSDSESDTDSKSKSKPNGVAATTNGLADISEEPEATTAAAISKSKKLKHTPTGRKPAASRK